ncbi:tripartite tricarboxylate transporter TctB family protein [Rhizobium azibense]|uniref:Putative tricarboxylic transport membrane protein n=1 Tax=Rhizobium azibense TaxID=1136135 RepID=A0A4R3RMW0_9HYPH|nr:tripartite tricarboxylate transporter TctB family protein [Rhizobium azibense]TCU37198.1 putative tricarboxylic transport membrane protein [Rhizobium azibense]
MTPKPIHTPNRTPVVIAIVLSAIAAVSYWDASHMTTRTAYGMSASAASYFVALLFAVLAIGHLVSAFTPFDVDVEVADWKAVGWIGLALGGLIGSIWLGGGFILGSTLLFALTARSFGRKAFLVDLCLGAVIALFVFLLFNKVLTLALPQGPLEKLF